MVAYSHWESLGSESTWWRCSLFSWFYWLDGLRGGSNGMRWDHRWDSNLWPLQRGQTLHMGRRLCQLSWFCRTTDISFISFITTLKFWQKSHFIRVRKTSCFGLKQPSCFGPYKNKKKTKMTGNIPRTQKHKITDFCHEKNSWKYNV